MAKKNKIPQSVVDAPKLTWAWAEDKDGNPIAFEGLNRAMRRKHWVQEAQAWITQWNYNETKGVGRIPHYGWTLPSPSKMRKKRVV